MAAKSASAKSTEAKKPEVKAAETKASGTKAEAKKSESKSNGTKAAAPKSDAKKPAKAAAPKKEGTGKGNALQRPVEPSKELSAVIGEGQVTRAEVVSKIWAHIKGNNLQNPENKQEIIADDKLRKIFGKDKCTMFEMNKLLSAHMK